MPEKKTILIVDDHPLLREGLKSIIAREPLFEVVGEAGTRDEALQLAKSLKPELVLMDVSLPGTNGVNLTRDLREVLPETRIIIVSMHTNVGHITGALEAGAMGYISKDSAANELIHGLQEVVKGQYFLGSAVPHQVASKIMEFPKKKSMVPDAGSGSLTPREQEVMRFIAEGLSTKEVAEKLRISPKTVENHRANIMTKLDLHSSLELIRYAARYGLIDVDIWKE